MISDSPCIATILDLKLLLSTHKILEEYWQWPKINRVHLGIYLEEYFRLCIATNVIKTALTFSDGGYTRYGALERPACSGMPAQVDQSVYSNRPVQFFKLAMIDLSDRPPKLTQKTWWIESRFWYFNFQNILRLNWKIWNSFNQLWVINDLWNLYL